MRTTVQCSAVAVLIAASVWLVPAAVAQDAPAAAPQGGPKIESPEPEFDFGSIDNEEKVEHDFVIKNVGDALLEIARVKTSCGCTVAELKEKSLQPGAETIVSATMSIKGKQGVQTKYLTVESNDPAQPLYRLTLTGTAIASVNIEPRNLNFGRVIDDKPVSGTISVLIDEKRRPIHVTSVESTAPDQFATEVKAIEDGAKYEIVVTAPQPLEPGFHSARLTVHTDNPKADNIIATVTAQVVGDLEISPQQIMLRRSDKAGETSSQYLRIAAGRVKEFTIKSVVPPVDSVTAEITPRGKNDYLVRLSNMPLDGTLEGKELVIQTDIPNHPEIKLPFVVSKMPAVPAGANRPVRVGPTGQVPTGIRRPAEQPVPPAKPPAPPVPPAAPAN